MLGFVLDGTDTIQARLSLTKFLGSTLANVAVEADPRRGAAADETVF